MPGTPGMRDSKKRQRWWAALQFKDAPLLIDNSTISNRRHDHDHAGLVVAPVTDHQ